MEFKCLYPNSSFIFKGARYEVDGEIFKTDDKDLIEFLKQNVNFEVIVTTKAK